MKDMMHSGYEWPDFQSCGSHSYLAPALVKEMNSLKSRSLNYSDPIIENKCFDLGCGNGSLTNLLSTVGWNMVGVDPSVDGIEQARRGFPNVSFFVGSAYDDLSKIYGQYPVVISMEVVEHVYYPRLYASNLYRLLLPGGTAIISTPYHGYWKNLVMALSGKLDNHFTALWDHGHIKFWSIKTLTVLLTEAGFVDIRFERVGRIPALAKSMIAIARKPQSA